MNQIPFFEAFCQSRKLNRFAPGIVCLIFLLALSTSGFSRASLRYERAVHWSITHCLLFWVANSPIVFEKGSFLKDCSVLSDGASPVLSAKEDLFLPATDKTNRFRIRDGVVLIKSLPQSAAVNIGDKGSGERREDLTCFNWTFLSNRPNQSCQFLNHEYKTKKPLAGFKANCS